MMYSDKLSRLLPWRVSGYISKYKLEFQNCYLNKKMKIDLSRGIQKKKYIDKQWLGKNKWEKVYVKRRGSK